MKRVLCLAITLALVLTLAVGCGQNSSNQNPATAAASTAATTAAADDKTPITFTMYNAEANPNDDQWQSPVAKEITKETGVTLKVEYAVGDPKDKLSLMAASGDYPDLIYAKGDLAVIKNAGGVIKLDDLIQKDGPNLVKMYGDYLKRLRWSKDDPYIYSLSSSAMGNVSYDPTNGFRLQHAVVKEQGFPKLKTLQDYENAIKTYYEKHPTIDGQKTIPLSLNADDWRFMISVSNPAVFATGGSDDGEWYVDQQSLQAVRHLTRPEEKDYFKWLNHMNAIGLLDPESFVQKYDQYKAKCSTGRVLGIIDATWDIGDIQTALRNAGKEDRMYGTYPVTLNENIKYHEFQDTGYLAGWGISISTKCKDPDRAMKFLDWFATEKANILNYWGIEGVHYHYTADGKREFLPEVQQQKQTDKEFPKKTGIGLYQYPFPRYGNAVKDSTGNIYDPNDASGVANNYTNTEKEVLKAYGATYWSDLYPKKEEFNVKPYGAAFLITIDDPDFKAADTKVLQIGEKRIPEAILAKPDKFDQIWDSFQKELKDAGVDKISEQFTQKVKDQVEMWK